MLSLALMANQAYAADKEVSAAPGPNAGSQTIPASAAAAMPAGQAAKAPEPGAPKPYTGVKVPSSSVALPAEMPSGEKILPGESVTVKTAPAAPNYNEIGRNYYEKGDYGAAILEFNRQLDSNPGDVTALANRGLSFAGRGEYKIAIENLYIALSLRKDDVTILKYLAALYYLDREFLKSADSFERATTFASTDFEAMAGRGFAYMSLQKYESAIDDFTRTLYISPRDIRAYIGRGISLNAVAKKKAAISDLGSAIAISPKNPFAYLLRAEAYAATAKFSNAVADLNAACSLGYSEVCMAVKQAKADIAETQGTFVLQYSRKSPDEELYETSRKKLEQFYPEMRARETDKYFVGMLKPLID